MEHLSATGAACSSLAKNGEYRAGCNEKQRGPFMALMGSQQEACVLAPWQRQLMPACHLLIMMAAL